MTCQPPKCYKQLVDHGGGDVLVEDLSRDVIELDLSQAKLDFLKQCRNSNLVPVSLGNDRARLLTAINDLVKKMTMDRLLLVRTLSEYGLGETDLDEFVKLAKVKGEKEISARRGGLMTRYANLRKTQNA